MSSPLSLLLQLSPLVLDLGHLLSQLVGERVTTGDHVLTRGLASRHKPADIEDSKYF